MQHLIPGRAKHWRFPLLLTLHLYFLSHAEATLSVIETSESITIHLGGGANVSYLALAEPSLNPKPIVYAWHYDGLTNSNNIPRTGTDLLNAVIDGTTGTPWALSFSVGNSGLNTSFTIGSITSTLVNPLTSPVWTYWIQGGSEFVEFGDSGSFTFLVGSSLMVSPAYSDTRYLNNGSYDVWTISPFSYTEAPSDTHQYIDTSGTPQEVTFGTYGGSTPVLKKAPTALTFKLLPDGELEIVFSVVEGGVYQLEKQESLTPNKWQNLGAPFTAVTSQKTFTLPTDNPSKKGFFRLVRKE
jgi:hypothetical protein